jgi:hypothetical protein
MDAQEVYLKWRDRLAEANDPVLFPIKYIDAVLADQSAVLFVASKAAMVTRVCLYPGGAKVVRSLATAGDLNEILETLTPQIEAWAKENGCTHSLVEGRDGWRKALAPLGYQHHQTILIKEL